MDENLKVEVLHADQVAPEHLAEIHALCNRTYDADLEPLFHTFTDATHVIGRWGSAIVSHEMWMTRWLQPSNHLHHVLPTSRWSRPSLNSNGVALQSR